MKTVAMYKCRTVVPGLMAAAVTCTALLSACGGTEAEPEERLRQWLTAGQAAIENEDRKQLVQMISPAYADANDHERDDIEQLFRLYFFRQDHIKLIVSVDEIRLYGDTAAEIELTVAMAGTNDGAFGFSADAYRFELELIRDNNDWLLISARWGGLGRELH